MKGIGKIINEIVLHKISKKKNSTLVTSENIFNYLRKWKKN